MNITLPIPSKYRKYLEELRMLDDDFLRIVMRMRNVQKLFLMQF